MPKPEKRTATKVIEYWWCGDGGCTKRHATEQTASTCAKANRVVARYPTKPRTSMEEIRNRSRVRALKALELRESGLTWRKVGEHFDVSPTMAMFMARKGERIKTRLKYES